MISLILEFKIQSRAIKLDDNPLLRNFMHDFILAKEIVDELNTIAIEKGLIGIKKVKLEIGIISMAHDGHPEHSEDISVENLQFGLASITRNTPFEKTGFVIKKVAGGHWKITDIEV